MRWQSVLLCILLCRAAGWLPAHADAPSPFAFAAYADVPVKVDGVLDEACWNAAPETGPLYRIYDNAAPAVPGTTFRAAFDHVAVYFAIHAEEPSPEQLTLTRLEHDVWPSGTSIEVFLDPACDRHTFYQFAANLAGSRYEGRMKDKTWDAAWRAAARVGQREWCMEISIPFDGLGVTPPESGASWGMNLCRNREGGLQNSGTWAKVGGNFHNPGTFNTLVLGSPADYVARELRLAGHIGDRLWKDITGSEPVEKRLLRRMTQSDGVRAGVAAAPAGLAARGRAAFLGVYPEVQKMRRAYAEVAEAAEVLAALQRARP